MYLYEYEVIRIGNKVLSPRMSLDEAEGAIPSTLQPILEVTKRHEKMFVRIGDHASN